MTDSNESIELPLNEEAFKHLQNARSLGMDIGGSLVKIAYSSSYECKTAIFNEDESDLYSVNPTCKKIPTLNFLKFETKYIEVALDYMKDFLISSKEFNEGKCIKATGGGASKYKELISQKLGVSVEKEDELKCLINGCNFLIRNVPNEIFSINYESGKQEFPTIESDKMFPYLLVNIGSGVSILKVDSDENFQRVGGSTIGGATLWGLGSLLTNAKGFDEILDLAETGDNKNVDMLVKDIYGGSYDIVGLRDDLIASSIGKATRSPLDQFLTREEYLNKFNQADLMKSILLMICYDIAQLASLYARLHNIDKVFFGGYFIRHSLFIMKFLQFGVSYWSQQKIECLFLRHEGYLGAVGAFLKITQESDVDKYSWFENYAHSSGLSVRRETKPFDCFELNREEIRLVTCPFLLEPGSYKPDLIDLAKDDEARKYWLDCFQKTINTYEKQCIKTGVLDSHIEIRASKFKESYLNKLNELRNCPSGFGTLTVRSLLDLREHCMSEFDFVDVYSNEKRDENKIGLDLLAARCAFLETIVHRTEKWYELFRGLLAGNVYDYGAQAFIIKQKEGHLENFNQALNSIDDNLMAKEDFLNLMKKIEEYKSICIFVDNSGFDVVLGVLPLVIELLKNKQTKVLICANSKPAINDITHGELQMVIKKACALNSTLYEAFNVEKRLVLMETGSASPCLDLSRISILLANLIDEVKVDLVILEGMGRAIHTNFDAKFKCDCLKAAVLKNQWLAERLGFFQQNSEQETIVKKKFPVIFKYEQLSI